MKKFYIFCLFIISTFTVTAQDKLFVLCYHSFIGNPKNVYDINPNLLKQQIKILKDKGFKFVTYDDVKYNKITGIKNILVTIDDGYLSSYQIYKSIFKPEGIKPIFAIYPSAIRDNSKMYMSWNEVKELSLEPGVIIASHGLNHEKMNSSFFKKNKEKFVKEITESKKILEEKTGKKVEIFVYPYGINCVEAEKTIKESGYIYAFTISWGTLNIPISSNSNPYKLPRYMLTQQDWENEFKIIDSKSK